jgi:DNA repair exonuclease SbcCD ATPase subunit
MIQFKRIKIENFMSIKEQEIVFDNGVFAFEGKNGEGKTTTVLALLQGLFNKNVKSGSDVIEETYNRITGKPYRIEVEFEKNGSIFLIINDRIRNTIQIFQDNKDISVKGIKNQLKQIESILGYNYQLFSSFYYLSTITLQNIFDVSSDNNLVYRFFDIETLKLIEKKLKQQNKEIKTDIKIIDANITSLDKQIKMLNNFQHLDRENLMNKKMLLQDTLLALQNSSEYKKMNVLSEEIDKIQKKITEYFVNFKELKSQYSLLKEQQKKLEKGICPVCGSKVDTQNDTITKQLTELEKKMSDILSKRDKQEDKKSGMDNVLRELKATINIKEQELRKEINTIDSQLVVFEQEEKKYQQLKDNVGELEKQLELFTKQKQEKLVIVRYINTSLAILKSNAITEEYLQSFIALLNNKIVELSELLDFNIQVRITENKGKLKFSFVRNGITHTLNSLSAGEKTRVAVITLFAILETLQILSNNKFNLLVLDELLGQLDDEGVEVLQQILNRYRDKMTIFVMLHHNEIPLNFFDAVYKVKKTNGITNINKERR